MMIDGEIAYAGLPLRFGEGEEGEVGETEATG